MVSIIGWIVICVVIADLISGLIHWLEDTYCSDNLGGFIGNQICDPNIDHHILPSSTFSNNKFINRNWIQWLSGFIVLLLTVLIFGYCSWQFLLIVFISSFGNEIHCWQHTKTNHPVVNFLFDSQLIFSKQGHAKHHKHPYMSYYCIIIGFNNAWMERVNFWRRLESVISLFGVKPNRSNRRDYN